MSVRKLMMYLDYVPVIRARENLIQATIAGMPYWDADDRSERMQEWTQEAGYETALDDVVRTSGQDQSWKELRQEIRQTL